MQYVYEYAKRDENEYETKDEYHPDGFDAERGNTVNCKVQHSEERVFALACNPFVTVIIDIGSLVAY